MSLEGLNIEDFIDEVKKYRCLWDLQCEDNRRAAVKNKAWDLVVKAFIENYDELEDFDRIAISKKLQSKWRNLRDSYIRSQKKKPTGSSSKDYIFARNLSFLDIPYGEKLKIRLSSESEDSQETVRRRVKKIKKEIPFDHVDPLMRLAPSSDNFSLEYVGAPCSVEPLQVQHTSPPEELDDDRLFFESLLPATRHFDLDQKLQFRTEVLSLISKIRQNGSKSTTNALDGKL